MSSFEKIAPRVLGFDLALSAAITASWLATLDVRSWGETLTLCLALHGLRMVIWLIALRRDLRPVIAWEQAGAAASDAQLLSAEPALESLALRHALIYAIGWMLVFIVVPAVAWFLAPGWIEMGPSMLPMTLMQLLAVSSGVPVVSYPLIRMLVAAPRRALARERQRRGLEGRCGESSLQTRLLVVALGLVATPTTWLTSSSWMNQVNSAREAALQDQRHQAELAALAFAQGVEPPAQLELRGGLELRASAELPQELRSQLQGDPPPTHLRHLDFRRERALAAVATQDGRWILAQGQVEVDAGSFWLIFALFATAVLIWATVAIISITRSFIEPLLALRDVATRVATVGDLQAMEPIPELDRDEIGELTRSFNRVSALLQELAIVAQTVASGDLVVEITGPGELPESFRAMVEQLHDATIGIRQTALSLASAGAEIQAATQAQEAAAVEQSASVDEASRLVGSLAGSAAQISATSSRVLEDARTTLETTDEVARKIDELGSHGKAIGELLAVIRDIAERSDLLALNGSLEATRAGEAGRGFAIVAAEMRRLAERVGGTVADVSELVTNIEASGVGAVAAIERGRAIAERTADAARRISEETQRQSAESEHVSRSVRQVEAAIERMSSATTQTRDAAVGLRAHAEDLERLSRRFRLRADDSPPPKRD